MFDAGAEHLASQTRAMELGPKKPLSAVDGNSETFLSAFSSTTPHTICFRKGLRYNVQLAKQDATKQRVVCIVNQDGIILVDPSAEKGAPDSLA